MIGPKVTEKAMAKVPKNIYSFEVELGASKHQIKQAVEDHFKVAVKTVTTLVRKGGTRRVGKRRVVKNLPARKFARVILSKGTIDIFPKS